jgi:hypothetical protein
MANVAGVLLDHMLEDEPHICVSELRVRHNARNVFGDPREHVPGLGTRRQVVRIDILGRATTEWLRKHAGKPVQSVSRPVVLTRERL